MSEPALREAPNKRKRAPATAGVNGEPKPAGDSQHRAAEASELPADEGQPPEVRVVILALLQNGPRPSISRATVEQIREALRPYDPG